MCKRKDSKAKSDVAMDNLRGNPLLSELEVFDYIESRRENSKPKEEKK